MMILFGGRALNDEFECIAVTLDTGGAKMAADDQRRRIGKAPEQFAARLRRLSLIGIRGR